MKGYVYLVPGAVAALRVPCTYCGAQPGEACQTTMRTINRAGNPHSVRLALAAKQAKADGDPNQGGLL